MNLFDRFLAFHKKHRWLSHVTFWLIYLLIGVSSSKYRDGTRGTYGFEFTSDALYMSAEMVFAYALAYFVVPQFVYRKRYLLSIVGFLLSSYAACVLGRVFIVKICEPMAGVAPKAFETYTEIFTNIPKLLYNYNFDMMAAASIFVFFKILKDQLEAQKRVLIFEKEKAETELKLLKTQLNPHFLFNTLNNLYSLSFTSSAATSQSIARLADILDHMLYRSNTPFVSLKAEIGLINNYIELEKLRYDDRLTVNFNTRVEGEVVIAPLIVLSLVENAFKHGASDDTGAPEIDIDLHANEQSFIFKISNTVAPKSNGGPAASNERIGLNNLRRQLELIYRNDYALNVTCDDRRFHVELSIKLKQALPEYEESTVFAG
ncbi:MAG: histidine kinase [Bacteroidetes bacterium]|nr:histidine kinase [Bacteroidota bacterium]